MFAVRNSRNEQARVGGEKAKSLSLRRKTGRSKGDPLRGASSGDTELGKTHLKKGYILIIN